MNALHRTLPVREIARQFGARFGGQSYVLDGANDAWLDREGRVSERKARSHIIGDVSHLHGAARISAACKIVNDYRARVL